MSDIKEVSGGFRQTTADGGATNVDARFRDDGNGMQFSGASVGIVRPTGQDQQWSVDAQVNAANGVINGGQVNVSFGSRPGEATPYTSTQQYTLPDGTVRDIELPGMRIERPDPGVDRTAVGVTVTGNAQQVAGDPLNVTATPQASLAIGANANGTTVVTGDVRAQLDSTLGQRDVGVQAQYRSDQDRLTVTPYQTDRDGNAALGNTMDSLYAPSRPQPGTPSTPALSADQAGAALREDPLYKQALGALQQQGHPLDPARDGATERIAASVAIAAQQQGVDRIDGVSFGNTVINAQGQTDRNVFFFKGEPSSELRVGEQAALSTSVGEQALKAQQASQAQQVAVPTPTVDQPAIESGRRALQ